MVRVPNWLSAPIVATTVAVGVSVVTTVAVVLASVAGWLLSRYLPFTPLEATGLWLVAGSVVTLVAAVLLAASMVSGSHQAQRELLERLAGDVDEWDDEDDDEEDEDEEDEDEEASAPIFVTPKPREAVARRVLSRARRVR